MTEELIQLTRQAMTARWFALQHTGIKPTVDMYNTVVKYSAEAIGETMTGHMILWPYLTSYSVMQVMKEVRRILTESRIKSTRQACRMVDEAEKKVNASLNFVRDQLGELKYKILKEYSVLWYQEYAIKDIEIWHNCYSAQMLKEKISNDNDNLRDLVAYMLTARDLGQEVNQEIIKFKAEAAELTHGNVYCHFPEQYHDMIHHLVASSQQVISDLHIPEIKNNNIDACVANWRNLLARSQYDTLLIDEDNNIEPCKIHSKKYSL